MSALAVFATEVELVSDTVAVRPRADGRATRMAEHGDLLGFAIDATRDRGLAEECVQEAFTKAR